jgi:hypothetical protein
LRLACHVAAALADGLDLDHRPGGDLLRLERAAARNLPPTQRWASRSAR